jgi:UDP-4-amino-4,6-dideoxy-N-acetyl-beta-L-altrosamine transaminase
MATKLVREKVLPYGRQSIDESDIQAVIEVLRSDYLTTGPKILEFETAFAEYVGAKYAVAVANGTAALHAAASVAGIGPGDEVITTPITFAASANCILYMGGKPVFADIQVDTYNIDPIDIRKKITSNTKAIIPVHFSGQPVDLDSIHAIASEFNLTIIEDAAHAMGAEYKGRKIGGLSDMSIFSFHPVKQITTGEGGMITTNNLDFYQKLLLFRSHGITRDKDLLEASEGDWYYEQQELGFNYRMTDFQAALGLSQLKKVDTFIRRRSEIAWQYNQAFKEMPELVTPYQAKNHSSSWHLYVIQLNPQFIKKQRLEVFNALKAAQLGVNVHYIPVYFHPYYRRLGYPKGICPVAESYYENAITLPLFPAMTDKDVLDVIETVKEVVR